MKALIVIATKPYQGLLVKLHTKELIKEVKDLIDKQKHPKAMIAAIIKGRFEREIEPYELCDLDVDLILSEDRASWDMT